MGANVASPVGKTRPVIMLVSASALADIPISAKMKAVYKHVRARRRSSTAQRVVVSAQAAPLAEQIQTLTHKLAHAIATADMSPLGIAVSRFASVVRRVIAVITASALAARRSVVEFV